MITEAERQAFNDASLTPLTRHGPRKKARGVKLTSFVCVTRHDHSACGFPPSPAFSPQVENVVQVNIGKQCLSLGDVTDPAQQRIEAFAFDETM